MNLSANKSLVGNRNIQNKNIPGSNQNRSTGNNKSTPKTEPGTNFRSNFRTNLPRPNQKMRLYPYLDSCSNVHMTLQSSQKNKNK